MILLRACIFTNGKTLYSAGSLYEECHRQLINIFSQHILSGKIQSIRELAHGRCNRGCQINLAEQMCKRRIGIYKMTIQRETRERSHRSGSCARNLISVGKPVTHRRDITSIIIRSPNISIITIGRTREENQPTGIGDFFVGRANKRCICCVVSYQLRLNIGIQPHIVTTIRTSHHRFKVLGNGIQGLLGLTACDHLVTAAFVTIHRDASHESHHA